MTLTPYVKTALAAFILPIFYHPSLHVYEASGKSFLDIGASPAAARELSEGARSGVDRKGSLRSFQKTVRRPGRTTASVTIYRHDFGVSWNSTLDKGGVVVGNMFEIMIDTEAILREE
jgi:hypothetical protein